MERIEKDLSGNSWSVLVRPRKGPGGAIQGYLVTAKVNGKPFMDPIPCDNKRGIHGAIAELLRWADKLGYNFPMASASRDRNFCRGT